MNYSNLLLSQIKETNENNQEIKIATKENIYRMIVHYKQYFVIMIILFYRGNVQYMILYRYAINITPYL